MVTGAALATINRLPVLLLPADTFADRSASPLLQELEQPYAGDVTVNDAFRPVSRYFDRVWRPEQLPRRAARARCGCSPTRPRPVRSPSASRRTSRPQAHDWPVELFARRVWHVARPLPETRVLAAGGRGRSARRSAR